MNDKISFNIKLDDKLRLIRLIELAKEISYVYNTESFIYEYTTDLKKITYVEKTFKSFEVFEDFFNSNDYRFDMLHLKRRDEEQICFQQSQGKLRVFGKVDTNDSVDKILVILNHNILYTYLHNQLDNLLSRSTRYDSWKRKLGKLPSYINVHANPKSTSDRDKYLIDLESMPTHHHLMDYDEMLWFGSCWQMYFSPIYYKYIPKSLFDDFTECEENLILEKGLRRITLYKNIEDYDQSENRSRQWAFRRALGIDSIAHELTRSANRIEPQDLPVLISKHSCKIGQTKVTRFLDANNKLVASNLAVRKEIKEYLDDGVTVVFEEITHIQS